MSVIALYAVPAFIILIVLEAWALRSRADVRGFEVRDTAASLTMGIGNVVVATITKATTLGLYLLVHQYALFDLGHAWWLWLLLIPAEDFCYYWFHRLHHEVRFLWAAHVNHHSSRHYNLSTALRQSWTTPLTGPVFWLPLALIGFDPAMVLIAQAISLLYQFWLHTETIDRLGPLEWVMNTPSHHRVHHGRNTSYLDRNHAGIFIVWDRLFGTFEAEDAAVDYGLTTNLESFHPVTIAFHEWRALAHDVLHARDRRSVLAYIFGPPGWREDGHGTTSAMLRANQRMGTRA